MLGPFPYVLHDFTGFLVGLTGALAMLAPSTYTAKDLLSGGRFIEIRALRPTDRADLLAAVDQSSALSFYRRFFTAKRGFTDVEIARFIEVDFVNHVALVAIMQEEETPVIVAGGRYIVLRPRTAELAFAVVDQYQGQGIGRALMSHLAAIAHTGGLEVLNAEVLADNLAMLKVFQKSGLPMSICRDAGVVHVTLLLRQPPK